MRPRLLALVLTAVLAGGCAGDDSPATEWADGVCSAWAELRTDVSGLTSGLSLDAVTPEALESLRSELEDRLAAIRASAQNLTDAITDTPEGANQAIEDAQRELSSEADAVRAGLDAVGQALQGVAGATTAEDLTAALSGAQAGLSETGQALTSLGDTVGGYASAGDDTLQQAFDDAQSCRQTRTGGTPS